MEKEKLKILVSYKNSINDAYAVQFLKAWEAVI